MAKNLRQESVAVRQVLESHCVKRESIVGFFLNNRWGLKQQPASLLLKVN